MPAERRRNRGSLRQPGASAALALCGCVALALGGCSSASEPRPPGPEQVLLITSANRVCSDFDARVQALAAPVGNAQVLSFVTRLQGLRERELSQLHALAGTPGTPRLYTAFVANLGALDELYGELLKQARAGSHEQVPAAVAERGRTLASAIAGEEATLALSSCAKNPAAGTRTSSSSGTSSAPSP